MNHVKVDDISLAIQGIQTAKRIGKSDQGSVDVLWINGENFARMKRDGLLGESFVSALPSAKNINLDDPTIVADFSVTTDGLEAPWVVPDWFLFMTRGGCQTRLDQCRKCMSMPERIPAA